MSKINARVSGTIRAQDTICDDCGKLVRHNIAHWMDDGASYCPSCRPLRATPSSAGTVSVEAAALPVTLTTAQLADACMSHRHDYGIVSAGEREYRLREASDWWRCLRKSIAEPSAALCALAVDNP